MAKAVLLSRTAIPNKSGNRLRVATSNRAGLYADADAYAVEGTTLEFDAVEIFGVAMMFIYRKC